MPAAPTTAGMPQPRATTAAWLARPPREVRMPAARAIPWTSSGEVSARTRIVAPAGLGGLAAASGFVAIGPLAIPGDAGSPVASGRTEAAPRAGGRRRIGQQRPRPARRPRPASAGKSASSAMSTAIRRAACGLRLPTRTWSIQSRPSSIVNSMSHRSAKWCSSRSACAASSAATSGSRSSRTAIGSVAWVPATTSSPWASNRTSP